MFFSTPPNHSPSALSQCSSGSIISRSVKYDTVHQTSVWPYRRRRTKWSWRSVIRINCDNNGSSKITIHRNCEVTFMPTAQFYCRRTSDENSINYAQEMHSNNNKRNRSTINKNNNNNSNTYI